MRVKKDLFDKHVKTFGPGKTIFSEGESGEELYVIIDGEVEIRKSTYKSSTKTLITLEKGDIFGEMALIESKSRSATAVATRPTKLLVMDEALFGKMIETNPDFSKKMIRILSERLRKANKVLQNIMVSSKEGIIVRGLFKYANEYGTPTFTGFRVNQENFIEWACNHLGVRKRELDLIIKNLLKKQAITPSAVGQDEFILKNPQPAG